MNAEKPLTTVKLLISALSQLPENFIIAILPNRKIMIEDESGVYVGFIDLDTRRVEINPRYVQRE